MHRWYFTLLVLLGAVAARADVVTRPVEYRHGDVVLEGVLAYDNEEKDRLPGVLVLHEDGGNAPQARVRAAQCARFGYVAFAADLYGKGVKPKDGADAARLAGSAAKDRKPLRSRAEAALDVLRRQPNVDAKHLAAVGYGVGGTAALELARGGAELRGTVCIHGDLTTPAPDAKRVKAKVLLVLGSDDPQVPVAQMAAFEDEMRTGGVDWQVLRFGGAVHNFTNPAAGRDLRRGSAFDATADKRAAAAVEGFLEEVFPAATAEPQKTAPKAPVGVPDKALKVLDYVDKNNEAPDNYEGGRNFLNIERVLPLTDARRRPIRYREWDVNPLRPGVNRGAERLVTGSDGSAYYTSDHYKSFKKIR